MTTKTKAFKNLSDLDLISSPVQSLLQGEQRGEGLGADLLGDVLPLGEHGARALDAELVLQDDVNWVDVFIRTRERVSPLNASVRVNIFIPGEVDKHRSSRHKRVILRAVKQLIRGTSSQQGAPRWVWVLNAASSFGSSACCAFGHST